MYKETCVVIMPDGEIFNKVYEGAIKPAVDDKLMNCIHIGKLPGGANITANIVKHIFQSKAVIIDLTDISSEILYKLGLTHGLGKSVIIITQKPNELPQDFSNYKIIPYKMEWQEDKKLKEELIKSFNSMHEWSETSNPVNSYIPKEQRPPSPEEYLKMNEELNMLRIDQKQQNDQNERLSLQLKELTEDLSKSQRMLSDIRAESERLKGGRQFAEDFFLKLFGEKHKEKSINDLMNIINEELEKTGSVTVDLPGRKKIKFRQLEGDERIKL